VLGKNFCSRFTDATGCAGHQSYGAFERSRHRSTLVSPLAPLLRTSGRPGRLSHCSATDGHNQLNRSGRPTIKLVCPLDQLGEDQRVDHTKRCWAGHDGHMRTVRRMIMWMLMIRFFVVIMKMVMIMRMIMSVARGGGPRLRCRCD